MHVFGVSVSLTLWVLHKYCCCWEALYFNLFFFILSCKCSFNRGTAELGEAGGGSVDAMASQWPQVCRGPGVFSAGDT